jgi:hypothetical protein
MNQTRTPMLSKSRFLAGIQCHLRLWHQCYNRELASEVTPAQKAIFAAGQEVGRLATGLFPRGVLIEEDHLHHAQAVQSTLAAMNNPDVPAIFEAAFIHNDVRVRVDILERLQNGAWTLIEVKSATSVTDVEQSDVGVQYAVLKGSDLSVVRAGILHLNSHYVYDGNQRQLDSLFTFSDITEHVLALQEDLTARVAELKAMLAAASAPQILPSRHCHSPYGCEFWEHCTADRTSAISHKVFI